MQENVPELNEAADPLQVTPVMLVSDWLIVPLTVTAEAVSKDWSSGALTIIVGWVSSILRVTEVEAEMPSTSVAVPPMTWPGPSAETVCGDGQVAIFELPDVQL